MNGGRDELLREWLDEETGVRGGRLEPLAGDASFRRYLRLRTDRESFVVMDAPPDREDSRPFIHVAELLQRAGLNVPEIHVADLDRGFLLLGDLGSDLYLDRLDEGSAPSLYRDALEALVRMQSRVPVDAVPPYDGARLGAELELFPEWFLGAHLGQPPTTVERRVLDDAFAVLVDAALSQPQVFVHRDYHSRNLMVHERNPGILDFQDAVCGPLTYDPVSLFRDAYVWWPPARVHGWLEDYVSLAVDAGLVPEAHRIDAVRARVRRDFDLMGVQRHIKVVGIFARLWHRDGKAAYLGDIPLVLRYLLEIVAGYPELDSLRRLFDARGLAHYAGAVACAP